MVLMKLRPCDPGDEQATISVRMATSKPTLSLSSSLKATSEESVLEIKVHLRCVSSKQPSRPITIATTGSMFDHTKPEAGNLDNLAQGMLPGLVCTKADSGNSKVISLGNFRVHHARQDGDDYANLGERPGSAFITIPSHDSGEEAIVTHTLTSERLFAFSEKVKAEDLAVGEKYSMHLREDYVGTCWWCWGDLEGDLKGKKFHAWSEGFCLTGFDKKPSDEEIEKENWVLGEDVARLKFAIEEGGRDCSVEVVE